MLYILEERVIHFFLSQLLSNGCPKPPSGGFGDSLGVVVVEVMIPFLALCLNLKMMLGKEIRRADQGRSHKK